LTVIIFPLSTPHKIFPLRTSIDGAKDFSSSAIYLKN
jgi:hypothetical protein